MNERDTPFDAETATFCQSVLEYTRQRNHPYQPTKLHTVKSHVTPSGGDHRFFRVSGVLLNPARL